MKKYLKNLIIIFLVILSAIFIIVSSSKAYEVNHPFCGDENNIEHRTDKNCRCYALGSRSSIDNMKDKGSAMEERHFPVMQGDKISPCCPTNKSIYLSYDETYDEKHSCNKCDGTGKCAMCDGTGEYNDDKCDTCDGSGSCPYCGGDGNLWN
ncbi:MAG: hypothetical protein K8T10_20770 [Candidatus Eremiobacteraeota bacterium]|nr:hypothetical protein [Candidatus Eremiobacteraeota bacterium]